MNIKEQKKLTMFRARGSAIAKSWTTNKNWMFGESGATRDIETLAKSLAGRKKR